MAALGSLTVSLVKYAVHRTTNQFVRRVSELLRAEGIHGQDDAGRVHHEVHDRVVLKNCLPLLLALTERLFRPLALGDVPPDASVADEVPRLIEHRQPRDGHVPLAAIGRRPRELEITERQMGVERLPMLAPGFFVRFQVGHFPARLADLRARSRRVAETFGELLPDKAMLRVALPIDVEGELHESAKAFFAVAKRRLGLLACAHVPHMHDDGLHTRFREQVNDHIVNPAR